MQPLKVLWIFRALLLIRKWRSLMRLSILSLNLRRKYLNLKTPLSMYQYYLDFSFLRWNSLNHLWMVVAALLVLSRWYRLASFTCSWLVEHRCWLNVGGRITIVCHCNVKQPYHYGLCSNSRSVYAFFGVKGALSETSIT